MPRSVRAWHRRRETGWARAADATVTVNDALAVRLDRRWRRSTPPLVVPNVPEPPDPGLVDGPPDLLREAAGLSAEAAIVLFQGRLGPGLGLDEATEAVLGIEGAALVLLGFGRGYEAERARDRDPRLVGRHVTLPARPPDELLAWTASADVALVPLPPISVEPAALDAQQVLGGHRPSGPRSSSVHGLEVMERLVRAARPRGRRRVGAPPPTWRRDPIEVLERPAEERRCLAPSDRRRRHDRVRLAGLRPGLRRAGRAAAVGGRAR